MTYRSLTVTDTKNEFLRLRDIPSICGTSLTELREFYAELLELCRPAEAELLIGQLTAMSIGMARRQEQGADYKALLMVYAKDLAVYPDDVIIDACAQVRRSQKFFPAVAELIAACEERFEFRRLLKAECELLLSGRKRLLTGPDDPANLHFKELMKKHWLPKHYDAWIDEAERMVELGRQNPGAIDVDDWIEQVKYRQAERDKFRAGSACHR